MQIKENDKVNIGFTIHAPIETVWAAWTTPTLISGWFGSDPSGEVLNAKLDVRPGGSFEITFKDSDETEHTGSGIYEDVQAYSRLTFSWTWKSEPGIESFVTITLISQNESTHMLFEHRDLGTGSRHDYLNGWTAAFNKLERLLTNK